MWEDARLGDVAPFKYGKSMTADKRINGEYFVYSSAGICGLSDDTLANKGIIIGRKGTAGSLFYSKRPFFCIDTAFYVDEVSENNDLNFMYYYMQILNLSSYNNDAAVPGLNRNLAHRLKIKLPNYQSQLKISDILSSYDDLIDNNNQRIEILEKAAENIYKEWFIRMRYPTHKNTQYIEGIPKGWKVKRLNEFGRVETGKTPPTANQENYDGDIMFIKTPDMHGQPYVVETGEYLTEIGHDTQPKKLLPANSISVSCIGTGGIVAINSEPAHTNQQINSIILDDQNYLEWLYFTAKALKPTIEMFGATGATMTNLSKGKFEKLKVICPNKELIYDFNQIASPMLEEIKELQKQNSNLVKQRDLLLPRLMSGKLEAK